MVKSFVSLLLFLSAGFSFAFDFAAVGDEPAVLYDTPSFNGIKRYIAPPHMPVEKLLTYEAWTKIRDVSGDMGWVESTRLTGNQYVIVSAETAAVHHQPDEHAQVIFYARKHVILEKLNDAVGSWIAVAHPDGERGFIRNDEIWGVQQAGVSGL